MKTKSLSAYLNSWTCSLCLPSNTSASIDTATIQLLPCFSVCPCRPYCCQMSLEWLPPSTPQLWLQKLKIEAQSIKKLPERSSSRMFFPHTQWLGSQTALAHLPFKLAAKVAPHQSPSSILALNNQDLELNLITTLIYLKTLMLDSWSVYRFYLSLSSWIHISVSVIHLWVSKPFLFPRYSVHVLFFVLTKDSSVITH